VFARRPLFLDDAPVCLMAAPVSFENGAMCLPDGRCFFDDAPLTRTAE